MSETLGTIMGIPKFSVDEIVPDFIVVPDHDLFDFQLVLILKYISGLDLLNGTVCVNHGTAL